MTTKSQTDNTELDELARLFANRIGSPYGEGATYEPDRPISAKEEYGNGDPNQNLSHFDDSDYELFIKDLVEAIQAKLKEQDIKSRIDEWQTVLEAKITHGGSPAPFNPEGLPISTPATEELTELMHQHAKNRLAKLRSLL